MIETYLNRRQTGAEERSTPDVFWGQHWPLRLTMIWVIGLRWNWDSNWLLWLWNGLLSDVKRSKEATGLGFCSWFSNQAEFKGSFLGKASHPLLFTVHCRLVLFTHGLFTQIPPNSGSSTQEEKSSWRFSSSLTSLTISSSVGLTKFSVIHSLFGFLTLVTHAFIIWSHNWFLFMTFRDNQ